MAIVSSLAALTHGWIFGKKIVLVYALKHQLQSTDPMQDVVRLLGHDQAELLIRIKMPPGRQSGLSARWHW
ncbi:hypothetical protein LJR034_007387 [Caballeronia sp. LjRoot34]|uniref:hypothetical protein n=1 Tax=Caballeronia sp. LjRoot34 TaxID=3342325 RepID=UPI003ECCDDB0